MTSTNARTEFSICLGGAALAGWVMRCVWPHSACLLACSPGTVHTSLVTKNTSQEDNKMINVNAILCPIQCFYIHIRGKLVAPIFSVTTAHVQIITVFNKALGYIRLFNVVFIKANWLKRITITTHSNPLSPTRSVRWPYWLRTLQRQTKAHIRLLCVQRKGQWQAGRWLWWRVNAGGSGLRWRRNWGGWLGKA